MIQFVFDMISKKDDKEKEGWQDPVAAYGQSIVNAPVWQPQQQMPAARLPQQQAYQPNFGFFR